MILEEKTFKKFGYFPKELKQKSAKRILAKCDKCGKIREICKYEYRCLCKSCAHLGNHHSEESIQKIREGCKDRHHSEETKQKIRKSQEGEKGYWYGKHPSEETRQKLCVIKKGKYCGENNPNWQGGISFEPYCILFNDELKERVREFWNRKCVICGRGETENGKKLSVHHVLYNKNTCCDNSTPLFVVLCTHCHMKTNYNRKYWENEFERIIYNHNTDGKCFYTKEEIEERKKNEINE